MATWEYHVEQVQMIERWSGKKQAEEFDAFTTRMNALGSQGWEMVGYEPIFMKGNITGNTKGTLHICFFKRQTS
jgi:Domain of unknown function (DUF4177)